MSAKFESIIEQLKLLVNRPTELPAGIPKVQQEIWDGKEGMEHDPQCEILCDLAYDLNYYQPNERVRSQDKSLYGEERALSEIREALAKLEGRG
jgi:hypothetical protein